jgi:hypothetical protein
MQMKRSAAGRRRLTGDCLPGIQGCVLMNIHIIIGCCAECRRSQFLAATNPTAATTLHIRWRVVRQIQRVYGEWAKKLGPLLRPLGVIELIVVCVIRA